ncbi:MAG: hypothetical protein KatS3mg050_3155 [Litorilinea sp.]|nr:MAG: hypothetical protein KatS3mg050_3155 [Litorilinea sp.]
MESDPSSYLILIFSLLAVGFAVASEISLTNVSRSEIRRLSEEAVPRAMALDGLLRDTTQVLLTSLLVKSAGLVAAGAAMVRMLPAGASFSQFAMAFLLLWIALVIIQVGGRSLILPRSQRIALQLAPVLKGVVYLLWPLCALLRRLGTHLGKNELEHGEENLLLTEEGIRLLINVADEEEAIPESEKQMIASILEMNDTVVREVMVPRIDMVAINVETSLREALDVILTAGHSRIPVYEGNIDRIVGFLYAKDLLHCFRENRTDVPIRDILRPAYFVPISKKVNTLLGEMQKHRVHIAMVVDEYGGTAGLVTIEDILEEIVGDIQDEYDAEEDTYVLPLGDNSYLLNSRLDVYSLSKLLDVELPDEDADTLGGLIYSLLGHVPEQGESVTFAGWHFTVLSLDGRRIDQVRADPVTESANPEEESTEQEGRRFSEQKRSVLNLSASE